nr:uncharacterized protein At4g15970-like [Ipomoea batatas]
MSYHIGASTYETIMEILGERKNSNNNNDEENKLVEEGGGRANQPFHHNRHRIIPSNVVKILVLFTILTLSGLLLYQSTSAGKLFPNLSNLEHGNFSATSSPSTPNKTIPSSSMEKVVENSVEKVLEKAAMANRTVIITTLNAAWTTSGSLFDLFLESFRIGNQTEGLLKHLDADIMWLRQPFSQFYPDTDFQIACDQYGKYDSSDLNNYANGGFYYVKSNNRSIQFYKFWYKSRDAFPGKNDQDVVNVIKSDPFIKQIGLKIRFLNTAYIGGFCEPRQDLNLVCTMHANCCVGLGSKTRSLKMVIDDWKKYMGLASNEKTSKPRTWTVPRCG